MEKGNKLLTVGLTLLLVPAILGMFVLFALAQPTADSFGVEPASGYKNSIVTVPVTISNTQNGPITCIIFDVSYNNSVINVVDVKKGTITSSWKSPAYYNFDWGTKVSVVYTGGDVQAIQNGSSGFIALLKLSVVGEPGETTDMCLNNIQLSDLSGDNVGFDTAPAKNGTFTIVTHLTPTPSSTGSPSPTELPTVSPAEESEEEAMAPDDAGYIFPTATPTITPSVMPTTASPTSVSPLHISSPSSAPTTTSTPTPNPPGFDAIFAIAGLLAVAYLVLRRKKAQP